MEIQIKKAVKSGNSSAVILPKSWLNKEVRVELVEKSPEKILSEVLNIVGNYLDLKKIIGVYQELRISPKEAGKKTATTFDFSQKEGDSLRLYISIRPAIEKTKIKFEFEKSYTFSNNHWNENSWSFPDNPFLAS